MNNTDIKSVKTAIKRLKPFADSKPTLPILNYVKVQASNGKLSLTIGNIGYGTAFTTVTIPATGEYSLCVKFADLMKVIDKCKSDIHFSTKGLHELNVESGSLTFRLNGRDTDDFPERPDNRDSVNASTAISYGDISTELEFVYASTDDSTPRNFTSGVLFDYTRPERLRLVGTDGRRLHSTFTKSRCHSVAPDFNQWLVPVQFIKAFNRLQVPTDETVNLEFDTNGYLYWSIPTEGLSGTVSLLDTPYPDYDKVIPDDCTSRFRLHVPETIEALNALSVVATQQDGRDMIVVNANGTLNLSARSDAMGEASGMVPCVHLDGSDTMFALNVHYFTETLKLADKREVVMSNSGSLEPVRFDYGGTDRVAVVMPVRLPE
ncbi:MAG: DNA polymerase III subunit beta [bacterium]|nr:DNA polymerase III subunit beta [bacterium]